MDHKALPCDSKSTASRFDSFRVQHIPIQPRLLAILGRRYQASILTRESGSARAGVH